MYIHRALDATVLLHVPMVEMHNRKCKSEFANARAYIHK